MIYQGHLDQTEQINISGEKSLYDLSMLEELEDMEYLTEILAIFLKETPEELKELRASLTSGNPELIYKAAHKLKNSAGILQADGLIQMLLEIESISKSGAINERLVELVAEVHREYKNVESALKKHLETIR